MVYVQRDAQGRIVSYGETPFGSGDEFVNMDMTGYSRRFVLSVSGQSGITVQVAQGSGDVTVEVSCPERAGSTVAVSVNGVAESVELDGNGHGTVILSSDIAGVFMLRPADETQFCAAGCGSLAVEVT